MRAPRRISGPRALLTVAVAIVAVAALFGALIGVVVPAGSDRPVAAAIGPFAFAVTPLNMAIYGAAVVTVVLGIGLALVVAVSRRFDDAAPGRTDDR